MTGRDMTENQELLLQTRLMKIFGPQDWIKFVDSDHYKIVVEAVESGKPFLIQIKPEMLIVAAFT